MTNMGTLLPPSGPTFNIPAGIYTAADFVSRVQTYVSGGATRSTTSFGYYIRIGSSTGAITQYTRNIVSVENVVTSGTGSNFPWSRNKSGEKSTDNVNWSAIVGSTLYFDAVTSDPGFWVDLQTGINFL